MGKVKVVAVLLGPTGVGIIGLYTSLLSLIGSAGGMGVSNSGVREIADANASADSSQLAKTALALRKVSWILGAFSCLLTTALAYPLSLWMFHSPEYAWAISALGLTLFIGAISAGQKAIIQGTRRLGDLARINVLSVLGSSLFSIPLYWFFGERAIIPVFFLTSTIGLFLSWNFARRIQIESVKLHIGELFVIWRRLLGLGIAFMWAGLVTSATALIIRAVIVREMGVDANGIYQAAWGISGMFAGFILSAMGMDFYPRLTGLKADFQAMTCLVNEQTEIGLLLAIPGILATILFSPLVMTIFYSAEFLTGTSLLVWFSIGIFGRIISWPLGFVMLALGKGGVFSVVESFANILYLVSCLLIYPLVGLVGFAIGFFCLYAFYFAIVYIVATKLINFSFNSGTRLLILLSCLSISIAVILRQVSNEMPYYIVSTLFVAGSGILCLIRIDKIAGIRALLKQRSRRT
jgi:PST family polysaccharide transporter